MVRSQSGQRNWKLAFAVPAAAVAAMWLVHVSSYLFTVQRYGIVPREPAALPGILAAPFLHANWEHLVANTLSFLMLGVMIAALRGPGRYIAVSVITAVIAGLGTWLIGSYGLHLGASGVIFGYLGYLLFVGVFERTLLPILISVVSMLLWGGMVWGVMPGQVGISWEGHLFGFVGGVVAARVLRDRRSRPRLPRGMGG